MCMVIDYQRAITESECLWFSSKAPECLCVCGGGGGGGMVQFQSPLPGSTAYVNDDIKLSVISFVILLPIECLSN